MTEKCAKPELPKDFNYEKAESDRAWFVMRYRRGAFDMPNGTSNTEQFKIWHGITLEEYAEVRRERHSSEMATQQRPSKPRGMK